ncbi:MAG: glycosyltransferase [Candidatus Sumerlaeaceae bacterium]|nr:glycosyltransferase [Candidatus Sumerlaeaceae bacterium]
MKVVIFGCGPLPTEPEFPVTAPGARTWQIVQTVVNGLVMADDASPEVVVVALDSAAREGSPAQLVFNIPLDLPWERTLGRECIPIVYAPCPIEKFKAIAQGEYPEILRGNPPDAIVATGSVQPYATASIYARVIQRPLWVDVFGDPLAEVQTRAELLPERKEENDALYHHTWKLLMESLLQGDMFSSLSERHRFALMGHLGVAGRLNRSTRCYEFIHTIPYGVFSATAPPLAEPSQRPYFVAMWCGSFNTWMDVETLASGVVKTWKANRRFRLLVVGGTCPGYNEISFARFAEIVRSENASEAIRIANWQPLRELQSLYSQADVGLSIDRPSYEALLGSRTRLVHFLLAGKPVISTTPTELAQDLELQGFVIGFRMGDSDHLAESLLMAAERKDELADLGRRGRDYVLKRYNGRVLGAPLMEWLECPHFAPDKRGDSRALDPLNPLTAYWQRVLEKERTS